MSTKNRLTELQNLWDLAGVNRDEPAVDVPVQNTEVYDILSEVTRLRACINQFENNTQRIWTLHRDIIFNVIKQLQDQLRDVMKESETLDTLLCSLLQQFEEHMQAATTRIDVVGQIARFQYPMTRRLYCNSLEKHYNLLQEQIRLIKSLTIYVKECQKLLDANNISILPENMNTEIDQARRLLCDLKTRHRELLRVEGTLTEFHYLFNETAQLDRRDRVVHKMMSANIHLDPGGYHLLKGAANRKKARKKMRRLIVCLAVGFAIVLLSFI